MIYIKTTDGKKITAEDWTFYCKCPKCSKETIVDEEIVFSPDFDWYSAIYCNNCTEELISCRSFIKDNISAIESMPANEISKIFNSFSKYSKYNA